jgi:hypothetical protein
MAMEWIFSASLQGRNNVQQAVRRLMARLALTFLSVFLYLSVSSQHFIWSAAARNDRALQRVQAVAQSDTIIHVIEERDDHILHWLRYGAESLGIVGMKEIVPVSDQNTLEYFFIYRDTLHTLSTRWNRESDNTEVYIMRYDTLGRAIDSEQLIHTRNESSEPRQSGLQCRLSPDSSRVLLFFDKENERKQTEGIHFKCFDRSWNLSWEKDLRLPPTPDILQVHHFLVDNYGGVYMMSGRKPVKTASDWQHPQGGQYVVYYYNAERNKLKQYDISLKDKQVISVGFQLNRKQEVIIAGYYSDNFQHNAAGTLLFSLQARGGPISLAGYTPFSKEFLRDVSGREKGSLEEFYLDYVHITSNGYVVLAGEQYYVSRSVSTDPTSGRQIVEYRYNYDDVMVCMMDTLAQHIWNIHIPKRQVASTLNDPNFSYSFVADSTGIALTFNDDAENNEPITGKKRPDASSWIGTKNSVTTRVDIGYDGAYKRRTLLDNGSERLLFNPLMTASGIPSRRLLGFDDKRTYKFCRIP